GFDRRPNYADAVKYGDIYASTDYPQNSKSHSDFRNNKWRNGLLKTKISKFKPFRDVPERFLKQVEWEVELNEVPMSEWVSAFRYFLDPNNGSFLWYQSHLTDFENNWKLFSEIF